MPFWDDFKDYSVIRDAWGKDRLNLGKTPEKLGSLQNFDQALTQRMELPNRSTFGAIDRETKKAAKNEEIAFKAALQSKRQIENMNAQLGLLQIQANHASAMGRIDLQRTRILGRHGVEMRHYAAQNQNEKVFAASAFKELDRGASNILDALTID